MGMRNPSNYADPRHSVNPPTDQNRSESLMHKLRSPGQFTSDPIAVLTTKKIL